MEDIYSKKFSELTEEDKKALAIAIQALRAGDTVWHTDTTLWGWALSFVQVVLDTESKTRNHVPMYVEFVKENGKYGISILKFDKPTLM